MYHPRNDYREFLELRLVLSGEEPDNFIFRFPGAIYTSCKMDG